MKIKESLSTIVMASVLATYITIPVSETASKEHYQFIIGSRDISYFQKLFVSGFKNVNREFIAEPPQQHSELELQSQAIYRWFLQNQADSTLGLVTSYPEHKGVETQAFTYDQALAGIVFLKQGDVKAAEKIFQFFYSEWDGNGFWTVYHSQKPNGPKIEYMRIVGPTAWVGLFSLHYYSKTGDPLALRLATDIAHWIAGLPHKTGGVAMGNEDIWKDIYSVENNLNYYALLKALSVKAESSSDRQLFQSEFSNLKKWFKEEAYNPSVGFFKRGAYRDATQSLDSNSWAVLAFGVVNLKYEFGVDANFLIKRMESFFAVQDDGTFGQNVLAAKGFDFSDANNAGLNQRPGMKWVEGTNQMILVYKMLNAFYAKMGPGGKSKAFYYQARANHFSKRNGEEALSQGGTLSYPYTDAPGTKIWSDNPYWFASKGPSVASTAWVYFSSNDVNPFLA